MKTLAMKKLGLTAALSLMLTGAWAQTQQDRTVGDFTGIKAGGIFTITVTQGSANAVKVEAEEGVLPNIKTEVKDNVLEITTEGKIKTEKPMNIMLTVKELKSVEISGAAKLTGKSEITGDNIMISTSGAGQVELPLKMSQVKIDESGAASLKLSGATDKLDADVSGAASLKAFELEANTANVRGSGAASIKVNSKSSIAADASGASSIKYKGQPTSRTINKSGSGSIKQADTNTEEGSNSTTTGNGDTTKVNIGKKQVVIINDDEDNDHDKDKKKKKYHHDKDDFKHWSGIDLGVNGYLNSDNGLSMPSGYSFLDLDYARSLNVSLNFLEKDIHLYRNYANIVTGLGIEFGNYGFKNDITLQHNSPVVAATWDSTINYSKNKLRTTFINLPVMLEFNTSANARKAVHLAGGVIFGYKLGSKTKQEFELNGREYEIKTKDDFNLSPFRYSATVRAGYGGFTIFANYALSTLFQKGEGPKLYPFTAGIALNFN
jgi:hypothetical protein